VLALLVTPGAAASLLSRKLKTIIGLSIIMAVFATVIGFYASYYADVASGPAIVLTLSMIFIISYGLSKVKK
jgi:ABC-type Mn2+/Zn2+ transport system permease subunit